MGVNIYDYEVEFKLTNKNTKAVKMVTRREHAYNIQDALTQGMLHASAEHGSGSHDFELIRIGPPMDAIRETADAARKLVDMIMTNASAVKAKAHQR